MYEKALYMYEAIAVYALNVDRRIDNHYSNHLQHYLDTNNITEFLTLNNLTYEEFKTLKESDRPTWIYPSNQSNTFPVVDYAFINATFNAKSAFDEVQDMFSIIVNTTLRS